jgi:hypothetical protein
MVHPARSILLGIGCSLSALPCDDKLRLASESGDSDEVMAAIAVDSLGGINIAVVRSTTPDGTSNSDTRVTVRYARWPSATALAAGTGPFRQDLSVPFVPWTNGGNEYLTLSTAGCSVYAAYAADPDAATHNWDIYVHRIVIPCAVADVTADGTVNSDDVVAFGVAYPPGLQPADVNRDGVVNGQDVIDFLNDYACGGCPH